MRVKEVAKELGISGDWLRDLEKAGRIPSVPRDHNGHRRYRDEDLAQLRRILFGNESGRQGETCAASEH